MVLLVILQILNVDKNFRILVILPSIALHLTMTNLRCFDIADDLSIWLRLPFISTSSSCSVTCKYNNSNKNNNKTLGQDISMLSKKCNHKMVFHLEYIYLEKKLKNEFL